MKRSPLTTPTFFLVALAAIGLSSSSSSAASAHLLPSRAIVSTTTPAPLDTTEPIDPAASILASASPATSAALPTDTVVLSENLPADLDLNLLRSCEGFTDYFVVPPAPSGPTIGHGLDLGNMGTENIRRAFQGITTPRQLAVLLSASGKHGQAARSWASAHRGFRLPARVLDRAFTRLVLFMYNDRVLPKYGHTSAGVRSALLSYAYHNGGLDGLGDLGSGSDAEVQYAFRRRAASYRGRNPVPYRRRMEINARLVAVLAAHREIPLNSESRK